MKPGRADTATGKGRPLRRPEASGDVEVEHDLDAGLGELLDDDRRDRARQDLRDRDLRRLVERDTATFLGILRDVAEQQLTVVLDHLGGRVAGRVVRLGPDHVALRTTRADEVVLVALWAISAVETTPDGRETDVVGRREPGEALGLRDVLAEAAEDRPDVVVLLQGRDQVVSGTLRAVGEDVLSVGPNPPPGSSTLCRLDAVVRVVLRH